MRASLTFLANEIRQRATKNYDGNTNDQQHKDARDDANHRATSKIFEEVHKSSVVSCLAQGALRW